jgi:N-acylneuraminate cytidylyltransferase
MNYQLVIPARGGSKRLKGKNIIPLGGIPLIAHSILYAKKSLPDLTVFVNTDDLEIAEVARSYGAQITERPAALGLDTTSSVEVLQHQLQWFEQNQIPCDAMILLQATNPLRPDWLMEKAIRSFETANRKSLAGFSVLNRKYGQIDSDHFFHPENYQPGQRMQDLIPRYYENGLIYITQAQSIREGQILTPDVFPLVVDHVYSTVDIDEPQDLAYAAYILENHTEND